MSEQKERYDDATQTLWLWRDYDPADTLVPDKEADRYSELVRQGEDASGRAIKKINYVFADPETAEYNMHALGFLMLGTYVGTLDEPSPYQEGGDTEVSFGAREDFGIS